jgi:nucleolar protein 58
MLVLYETAMGYCLFKISDTAQLEQADLYKEFETPERANKLCVTNAIHAVASNGLLDLIYKD